MKRQVLAQRTPDDGRRPLRGRDAQLDQVLDALRAAGSDGSRRTLLLAAPVGAGKTRLLLEAASVAESIDFSVVDGIADLPVVRQPHAVAPDATRLSWLTAQFERQVETQLRHGPVLVVVDDLHWADPLTVTALRSLMTRLDDNPVVWIFAMRAEDLDSPNGLLLDAMATGPRTEWLRELEPLRDDAVTDVVTDLLDATPDADVASLCECMGGNPRAIVDLVRGLQADEALRIGGGIVRLADGPLPSSLVSTVAIDTDSGLPRRFRTAVRELLDRLDPSTRQVLQVAAVLGRSFSPQDLAAMLSTPPATLLKPLQEAAGFVGCLSDAFEFRREPVWRAVLDTVPPLMRSLLHKQAAELSSSDVAAVHLLHCGPASDERSIFAIRAAADRLLGHSPETAAALAVRGLEVADQDLPSRDELARTAVAALTRSGSLDRAVSLARPGQDLAVALLLKGEVARAARIGAGQVRLAALAYGNPAAAEKVAGGWDGVSLTVRAMGMWRRGRVEDALATAQKAGTQESPWYFDPQWTHAWMQIRLRRLAEASATIRAVEDRADSAKVLGSVPLALRSWASFAQGNIAEAESEALAGVSVAADTQMPLYEPHLRAVLVLTALRRGDVATAADRLQSFEGLPWSSLRTWVTAQIAAARSGPEAALAVLAEVRTDSARRRELLLEDPAVAAWCVRTAIAADDEAFARTLLASAEELGIGAHARALYFRDVMTLVAATEQYEDRWARASATEDLGALLRDYDRDEAVSALDRAMEFYDSLGAAWDSARVRSRLRRLGVRRRHWHQAPRPATGWGSLTGTEEKVARLVAHGLTNRQVATELFVSPHTVGFHLRQIYRKLAIQSRVDLARIAP
ncbi:ATP-binding protein [Kutzneria buriramensis]|uniref:ATP/maltotriose-dependent transcriptional regulator MalT n=1 Tax=Kutzneria buriramensis TaxID=1045776 RepID=A0A3E0GTX9_9PSEU|nr:LuxR C-terminal-related transcriptional regulator [Kutzneria buriramensis]REH27076.1 ATP/maltotriose-dependent transcriptional regulator MalT [Kutzneria buriramensis]